ncbi:Uncharacterised protein [uncultured archaeon]|nr:Uncharacterised protein [uncultured archaeon]
MKAFVNSLLTIMVSAILLELLFSFQAFNSRTADFQEQLFAAKYADYYFDDITYDLRTMAPNNPTLRRVNSTAVAIGFTVENGNFSFVGALANYSQKIAPVAQKLNLNVSIDASNVTSNDYILYFSNGVVYDASYDAHGRTTLTSSDAAAMTQYNMTYVMDMMENSLNQFDTHSVPAPDDVRVIMNYTDMNGSVYQDGYLSSGSSHVFQVNYANLGQFGVHIQKLTNQPASLYIIKDQVPDSYTYVDATMNNNGTYEVYAYLPILVRVSGLSFSKTGYLPALRA